jgi:RNA polymerase sigma-70 factor, ECF subfamily
MFRNRFALKSDEELMSLLQQGEAKALTEIYKRYGKLLIRYFFRMLWRDQEQAEDFLHDLFVRIIEKPQHFDTKRKFSTWIYSVAHNMCKNAYRKEAFRNIAQNKMETSLVVENTIAEELDKQSFMKTLEKAMTGWTEDDRTLFVLRHELEMPFAEIATVLDCPEGTAKSRWFYLRKELAGHFREFQVMLKVI